MRALILQAVDIMNEKQTRWFLYWIAKWVLLILAIVLYTLLVARCAEAKASRKYDAWQERWVNEYLDQQEAAQLGIPRDPREVQAENEAKMLARVLYGVKDNSTDDLRTYCWCVFNRVDSADYADTLEEVIEQPSQWMRYSDENPVLDSLFQIAKEEIAAWRDGATRPCAPDFIYMTWSPNEIVLRNTWTNTSRTRYWRIKE